MRVALVHDWLTGMRGGERCLERIAGLYPDADVFTLVHVRGATSPAIERHEIRASGLSRLPGAARHYRKLLPLFPAAIERFDLRAYDLVVSTSHAVAKGVRTEPDQPHLSYCLTPMRYVWDQADAYLGRGLRRALAAPLVARLRRFDVATSTPARVTRFVAISTCVAERIATHYGRSARVVFPPVEVGRFAMGPAEREDFDLLVGGFVPYKREALAVEAYRGTARRLVVAGDGPLRDRVAARAPRNVQFVGRVADAALAELMRRARCLVYPQLEDFGIAAVEAQASGTPVVAFRAGGALDTVIEGETGVFFDAPTPASLRDALERLDRLRDRGGLAPGAIRAHALAFGPERFERELRAEIASAIADARPERATASDPGSNPGSDPGRAR